MSGTELTDPGSGACLYHLYAALLMNKRPFVSAAKELRRKWISGCATFQEAWERADMRTDVKLTGHDLTVEDVSRITNAK